MIGYEVLCKSWPGDEVKLFIAGINFEGEGLKHAAWRNWDNYVLVLFIWTISLSACDCELVGISGMSHRASDMLRLTFIIMFLFFSKT